MYNSLVDTIIYYWLLIFYCSFLQVRYLKIIEKSGYQALPWVRYITQNGDYFVLFDSTNPGTPDAEFLARVIAACPQEITVAHIHDVAAATGSLTAELKARLSGEHGPDSPPVFVFINGLHKFKKLRAEDDFSFSSSDAEASPGAQLGDLITEGSSHGIHLLVSVDTFNNVSRAMSRKALTEFEMRVVFQMSANDSASLIDSPKASNLGLHRALFYNEHEGTLETFRPYATPDAAWLGSQ